MAFIGAIAYMSSESQAVLLAKKDGDEDPLKLKSDDDPDVNADQRRKAAKQMDKDAVEVENKAVEDAGKTPADIKKEKKDFDKKVMDTADKYEAAKTKKEEEECK